MPLLGVFTTGKNYLVNNLRIDSYFTALGCGGETNPHFGKNALQIIETCLEYLDEMDKNSPKLYRELFCMNLLWIHASPSSRTLDYTVYYGGGHSTTSRGDESALPASWGGSCIGGVQTSIAPNASPTGNGYKRIL